jgi:nickel-dependent lactate racemase
MPAELKYGQNSRLHFDEDRGTEFIECQSEAVGLTDLAAAVESALAHPLDFPALEQAIVPGDKVVLALEAQVPQGPQVAEAIVGLLTRWGASAADITLLVAQAEDGQLRRAAGGEPAVSVHDPTRRDKLAYLAATPAGDPLYLNRLLCDADVVIPIASVQMHPRGAKASDGLYPVFSSKTAQPAAHATQRAGRGNGKRRSEPAERPDVSWLLGVPCLVQVIPGPGESVLDVLAGEPSAVRRESRRRCQAVWGFAVPHTADLVVAAIEGDASQQTWEQVGRALAAATRAVTEDGAIAICCELDAEPGPALQALAESDDRHAALKAIRRAHLADAQVAARLARACDRATVYLLSRLDDEVVEELGMAPVQDAAEVARLAGRHDSCILLASAQHAVALPEE